MSIPTRPLQCDRCGKDVSTSGFSQCVYELPDSTGLRVRWTLRWCTDCDSVAQFEALPSVETLDRERQTLLLVRQQREDKIERRGWLRRLIRSEPNFTYEEDVVESDLAENALYAMLYASRTDHGRCLTCGSPHYIEIAELHDEGFAHPGCGGVFRADPNDEGPRFNFGNSARVYSQDGRFVGNAWEFDHRTRALVMRDQLEE